jgi:hypothetical protein
MHKLGKYLHKRAVIRPLAWAQPPALAAIRQVVVIPACAESQYLPATLASLAAMPVDELATSLVIVVVNNRAPAPDEVAYSAGEMSAAAVRADNQATLAWLAKYAPQGALQLAWIDAASPGGELPAGAGVGLARKIGADTAIHLLAGEQRGTDATQSLTSLAILHLDADTLVEPNYTVEFRLGLAQPEVTAAVVDFAHQPADNPEQQAAIDAYERFLRYYVEGLRYAGSPYAFHTIGSTMGSLASAYVQVGGVPAKRQAGEDFYFLQELAKMGMVASVGTTCVHPSARLSARVPFGTGPRMREVLASGADTYTVYAPAVFELLRDLLILVNTGLRRTSEELLAAIEDEEVRHFLAARGFEKTWPRLQAQYSDDAQLQRAFHRWFDALATIRLIRHLSRTTHPEIPVSRIARFSSLASGGK